MKSGCDLKNLVSHREYAEYKFEIYCICIHFPVIKMSLLIIVNIFMIFFVF